MTKAGTLTSEQWRAWGYTGGEPSSLGQNRKDAQAPSPWPSAPAANPSSWTPLSTMGSRPPWAPALKTPTPTCCLLSRSAPQQELIHTYRWVPRRACNEEGALIKKELGLHLEDPREKPLKSFKLGRSVISGYCRQTADRVGKVNKRGKASGRPAFQIVSWVCMCVCAHVLSHFSHVQVFATL